MENINTGDTAWIIAASALVMLMTPGLAFFYGGLVRRKNILSIMMQCFILMGAITIQWVLFGYSLAFGPDHGGVIGGLSLAGLNGVGLEPLEGMTIPAQLFMVFQMMFAILTPALIVGAFVERMKFSAFLIFSLLWATIVYDPMAHWVWGGGWIAELGALDFAGGTVVHINAGMAALAACLVIGKRRGYPNEVSPPHNLPFAILGAAILWFGWFGFNAGSALSAGAVASSAFVVTHVAAATAAFAWAILEWIFRKKPTALGIISGAIAGLVAITPAAGFVTPLGALAIGAIAGLVCYLSVVYLKSKLGYDDSLDVFGIHGVGGIVGAVLTGLWATASISGVDGLFHGNPGQLWRQVVAVVVCAVYSFVLSWIILKVIDKTIGLRVSADEENIGLDLTQHSESAYTVVG